MAEEEFNDVRDGILAALAPVVEGLAATFGRSCEVVLHDYRRSEASVVAVAGKVTGRRAGGAMSEVGLAMLARGDAAANEVNYFTRIRGGRVIKSSTLPLKDPAGHLFGALCVNVDVTALRGAQDLIADLAGGAPQELPATTFSNDFEEVVDAVLHAAEREAGKPIHDLDRQQRLAVVWSLNARGAFLVRGAAPRIATALGISRASLYADLAEVRGQGADPDPSRVLAADPDPSRIPVADPDPGRVFAADPGPGPALAADLGSSQGGGTIDSRTARGQS